MNGLENKEELGFDDIIDIDFDKVFEFFIYDHFNILKQLISNGWVR